MKILVIGDVVGSAGRETLARLLQPLKSDRGIDFTIANCENSAGGFGINEEVASELFKIGIDLMTSGNHVWDKKEALALLSKNHRILRPANYPSGVPGTGSVVVEAHNGVKVGVINLMGRVFMDALNCPFRTADAEIAEVAQDAKVIIVDMHAEATSEKNAMGWYLKDRVTAVVGTHTHVQTADERILPGSGTAYISDIGMTGPRDSIIGIETDIILKRFIQKLPERYKPAGLPGQLNAVIIECDPATGKAKGIERIRTSLEA